MIDWHTGSWQKPQQVTSPDQRIVIAGDWAPIRRYASYLLSAPEVVYGDLLAPLRQADLRVINLETSLSSRGTPVMKDGPNLQGRPAAVAGLTCVPFDVACLANNHMMDYGPQAMQDTRALLAEKGIRHVGAGMSRAEALAPLIVDVGATQVGIVNFCEGEDGASAIEGPGVFGWELDEVMAAVQGLRQMVDVVLVVAHAGREYTPAPPPYLQRAFRTIARAGADLVVGHHPHVPQGIEIVEGVPIIYSLGNFIFFQETGRMFQRRGYLLEVSLAEGALSGFRLVPYALEDEGIRQLYGDEKVSLLAHLRAASVPLAEPAGTAALWHAFIDHQGAAYWQEACGGLRSLVEVAGEDKDAAAALRNRFITPAHRHFMADGLSRLIAGELGAAPAWAAELVERWRS